MIVSPIPLPTHQKVFHYCVNQTMQPHDDLEKYARHDPRGGYKAWFLQTNTRDDWLERPWLKQFATVTYHATLLERLLTVRTEWSRK